MSTEQQEEKANGSATEHAPDEDGVVDTMPLIHLVMPRIMGEVQHVAKSEENKQQNYQFRSYADVYAACRGVMAQHGVSVTHTIVSQNWIDREHRKSGKGGEYVQYQTIVRAVFRFRFTAQDGSYVETDAFGEASDYGDKAANKAMSMATKYALVDTFLIPTKEARDTEQSNLHFKPLTDAKKDQIKGFIRTLKLNREEVDEIKMAVVGRVEVETFSEADGAALLERFEAMAKENQNQKGGAK